MYISSRFIVLKDEQINTKVQADISESEYFDIVKKNILKLLQNCETKEIDQKEENEAISERIFPEFLRCNGCWRTHLSCTKIFCRWFISKPKKHYQ